MSSTSQSLQGKHAVVTGASRGIGAGIAAELVGAGARVSLLSRDAAALATQAARLGSQAAAYDVDVSIEASVNAAFRALRERHGPVHLLINNAGQAASAKFADTDPSFWQRIVDVNLTGTYLCSRAAIPDMLQQGFGRIVNIASTAGLQGGPYLAAYCASKHAVVGLTRALALEYATKNLTVNAVCPGFVDTDIVRDAVKNIVKKTGRSEAEALSSLIATNPQRRLVTVAEVANTVMWLLRPGSESVTGQSIVVAGGELQ